MVRTLASHAGIRGSNPLGGATQTHAKGAYKTPSRVSFSMLKNAYLGRFGDLY